MITPEPAGGTLQGVAFAGELAVGTYHSVMHVVDDVWAVIDGQDGVVRCRTFHMVDGLPVIDTATLPSQLPLGAGYVQARYGSDDLLECGPSRDARAFIITYANNALLIGGQAWFAAFAFTASGDVTAGVPATLGPYDYVSGSTDGQRINLIGPAGIAFYWAGSTFHASRLEIASDGTIQFGDIHYYSYIEDTSYAPQFFALPSGRVAMQTSGIAGGTSYVVPEHDALPLHTRLELPYVTASGAHRIGTSVVGYIPGMHVFIDRVSLAETNALLLDDNDNVIDVLTSNGELATGLSDGVDSAVLGVQDGKLPTWYAPSARFQSVTGDLLGAPLFDRFPIGMQPGQLIGVLDTPDTENA